MALALTHTNIGNMNTSTNKNSNTNTNTIYTKLENTPNTTNAPTITTIPSKYNHFYMCTDQDCNQKLINMVVKN